jgi:hypothetical protein
MLSRALAISLVAWLPFASWMLPMSPAFAAITLVLGSIAIGLAALSFVDDRPRFALGAVGALVALAPFIVDATLLEKVVTVSWGVTMLVCMVGPLSAAPQVTTVVPLGVARAVPAPAAASAPDVRHAA